MKLLEVIEKALNIIIAIITIKNLLKDKKD